MAVSPKVFSIYNTTQECEEVLGEAESHSEREVFCDFTVNVNYEICSKRIVGTASQSRRDAAAISRIMSDSLMRCRPSRGWGRVKHEGSPPPTGRRY